MEEGEEREMDREGEGQAQAQAQEQERVQEDINVINLRANWAIVQGFLTGLKGESLPVKFVQACSWDDEERLEFRHSKPGKRQKDPLAVTLQLYTNIYEKLNLAWECVKRYSQLVSFHADNPTRFITMATGAANWLWTQHNTIRTVISPKAPKGVVDVVTASWRCVVRTLLLVRVLEACRDDGGRYEGGWPLCLILRATENSYVLRYPGNIAVSNELIGRYSVNEWDTALKALLEAMHQTGWTPGARIYLNTLVARYATLLRGDLEDIEEKQACYNNPKLCIRPSQSALEKRTTPLPGLLSPAFVIEMERYLYYSMRHNMAAYCFYKNGELLVRSHAWRLQALEAMGKFISSMVKESASSLIDLVQDAIMGRCLMPGEYDRFLYTPNAAHATDMVQREDSETALETMRKEVYMDLQEAFDAPIDSLYQEWATVYAKLPNVPVGSVFFEQEEGDPDPAQPDPDGWWETIACRRPKGEALALLVIEKSLSVHFDHVKASLHSLSNRGHLDDCSLCPPRDAPPRTPEDALLAFRQKVPLFVNISRVYAVLDEVEEEEEEEVDAMDIDSEPIVQQQQQPRAPRKVTRITPHLIDAIAHWLTALVAHKHITLNQVHPDLIPLLATDDEIMMNE
jgi:hypothetical protein